MRQDARLPAANSSNVPSRSRLLVRRLVCGAVVLISAMAPRPASADAEFSAEYCGLPRVTTGKVTAPDPGVFPDTPLAQVETKEVGGALEFATAVDAQCTMVREQTLATGVKAATTRFATSITAADWGAVCDGQTKTFTLQSLRVEQAPDYLQVFGPGELRVVSDGAELILHFLVGTRLHGVGAFEIDGDSPDCDVTGASWSGAFVLVNHQLS